MEEIHQQLWSGVQWSASMEEVPQQVDWSGVQWPASTMKEICQLCMSLTEITDIQKDVICASLNDSSVAFMWTSDQM
jgi:uncharacterized membrane protein